MGQPVVHFEVHTRHSEELRSFYTDLFGWRIGIVPDGSYALVDTDSGGVGIRGGIAQSQGGLEGVMFYIEVEDIDAQLERVKAAGGRVVIEPIDSPQVTTAVFADPDGNSIGLAQRPRVEQPSGTAPDRGPGP